MPLLIQTLFILMHYVSYDAALFINGKRSVAESHTGDRKYLCLFHPCNEILKCMCEFFEISKKQDLTPPCLFHIRNWLPLSIFILIK